MSGLSGSQCSRRHHLRLALVHISVARRAMRRGLGDVALDCLLEAAAERQIAHTWHPGTIGGAK